MTKQEITWKPTKKQLLAYQYLEDKTTTELLFGGGAGGAKSYLGCAWLIMNCLRYKGSRWLMGRAVLKNLKQTTLLTFFDVCKHWGLVADSDFKYHAMEGVIRFKNGSEIYLKDLAMYPADPEFDSLGSLEVCGVFVDEGSQITIKAKNVLISRIRYKLDEFNIAPKFFVASNPYKNFLYSEFYKPAKEGKLPPYRKFVQALVGDNPYIPLGYIENLKRLDKNTKERLLLGNWEYDDDPAKLFEFDSIIDMFTNRPKAEGHNKFLIADIARFGSDKCVVMEWDDLYVKEIRVWAKKGLNETRDELNAWAQKESIPRSHILVDEEGVGSGVVDFMPGIKGFVGGRSPIEEAHKDKDRPTANYLNLRSQCFFYLSDLVNSGKIGIYSGIDQVWREMLIEELEQQKRADPDVEKKIAIIKKDRIKENIGRSPDFADALSMRMFFELKKKNNLAFSFGIPKAD